MRRRTRTAALLALATPALWAGTLWGIGPASAATAAPSGNPNLPIDYRVTASTTLAKLGQTVHVPPGTFKGSINTTTGALTGTLTLPEAHTTVRLAGIGLATATFELAPTAPVTGTVNFSNLAVTASASFNVLVPSVSPLGLPVNLVGNSCGTARPVHVTFSGTFSFGSASKFAGTYTIPPLKTCGLATPALNLVIPGPGNTFDAAFAPASG